MGKSLLKLLNREPMKNTATSPCLLMHSRLCTSGKAWLLGFTEGGDFGFSTKDGFLQSEDQMNHIFIVYISLLPVRSPTVIYMV